MNGSSSKARVAIVGGGLCGSLSALVLKQRLMNNVSVTIFDAGKHMLGGRLLGGYEDHSDGGAQFFRPQSKRPELIQLTHSMESMGLLKRWEGRFGMLGSHKGGFLPSSIMNKVLHKNNNTDDNDSSNDANSGSVIDGGDFCGFAQYAAQEPTYVAVPGMQDWCRRLAETEPDIQVSLGSKLIKAHHSENSNLWELQFQNNPKKETFDALILSTHDPSLAGQTLQSIISTKEDDDIVVERMKELQTKLQFIRDNNKQPVYSCSFIYPPESSKQIPLDAASVPGSSILQFISREASKPQRPTLVQGGELWKAISTSSFAANNMNVDSAQKQMENEMSLLFSPFLNNDILVPQMVRAKLWRAAFSLPSLQLKEDCVALYPWRFIISGDYVSNTSSNHMTPLEAAAMSGLQAGEHMSNILSSS